MPKVTEEYREARRREILDAAMRVFHRDGFQGASMASIIKESGLSAGAIYGHFPSRAELVVQVATRVVGARVLDVERLAATDPMPPPAHLLRILLKGLLNDLGSPGMLVQLWGEAVAEPEVRVIARDVLTRLRDVYSSYIALWHQREHGLSLADAETLAADQVVLFVSAAQGYILQAALLPGFDSESSLDSFERYLPA